MNNEQIELEQKRKEAIENDKAYGIVRLREEFRMKPAKNADPSYSYRAYGRDQHCYKVADCVPMRAKRKQQNSPKLKIQGQILGLKSTLKSNTMNRPKQAREALSQPENVVFLDTETTGLNPGYEVVQIAVVDASGAVLFDSKVYPCGFIEEGATAVHGLEIKHLAQEPYFEAIEDELYSILNNKTVVAFNSEFHRHALFNSSRRDDRKKWLRLSEFDLFYTANQFLDYVEDGHDMDSYRDMDSVLLSMDIDRKKKNEAVNDARNCVEILKGMADAVNRIHAEIERLEALKATL